MNGIFAYVGSVPCRETVLSGIELLKKRGRHTAGCALLTDCTIHTVKTDCFSDSLRNKFASSDTDCFCALAACADAYRTKPSAITAPPSSNNLFAVAIDGVVENFDYLKRWCQNPFPIATDEDLLLALLCVANKLNKIELAQKINSLVEGNPTFCFFANDENALYVFCGNGPVVIAVDDGGFFVSSELGAVIPFTKKYFVMNSGEYAKLTPDRVTVFDSRLKRVKKSLLPVPENSGFENGHILCDEVYYCPLAVRETYSRLVKDGNLDFDYLRFNKRNTDKISRIFLIGSSGLYNCAKIAEYNFSMLTAIPVQAYRSEEFLYSGAVIDRNTLVIAVSDSGEREADTACVRRAKGHGAKTIAFCSDGNSALVRECDAFVNVGCDCACDDASLRGYLSNYLALSFFALYLGNRSGVISRLYLSVTLKIAEMLAGKISSAVKNTPALEMAAVQMREAQNILVCGMGADYALSLEIAQKLRQIARVSASAVSICEISETAGGMLEKSLLVAVLSNKDLSGKSLFYLRRAKALGAQIIIFTTSNIEESIEDFENIIAFDDSIALFNALSILTGLYKTAVLIDEFNNKKDIAGIGNVS